MRSKILLALAITPFLHACGVEEDTTTDIEIDEVASTEEALLACSSSPNGSGSVGSNAIGATQTIASIIPEGGGSVLRVSGFSSGSSFTGLVSLGTGYTLTGGFGNPALQANITTMESLTPNTLTISGTQRGADNIWRNVSGTITIAGGTFSPGGITFSRASQITAGQGYLGVTGQGSGAWTSSSAWSISGTCSPVSASVSGTTGNVTFTAVAPGATSISYRVDGVVVGSSGTQSLVYDSAKLANGAHNLVIVATDEVGNFATSPAAPFTTSNVNPGPTATAAVVGTTGNITMNANVTAPYPVTQVVFKVDGVTVATDTTSPWSQLFNSRTVANGPHSLVVSATDNQGVTNSSPAVNFTTSNDFTAPTGQTASVTGTTGNITLSGTATDASGLAKLEFYVDGVLRGTDTTAPYSVVFNSRLLTNGAHSLVTRAYDVPGNFGDSAAFAFTTTNDLVGPVVSAGTPATLTGNITLTATATDATAVSKVEFYIDGVLRGTDTTAPYSLVFNSRLLTNAAHTLTARAYDTFNQQTTSTGVVFTTSNDLAAPVVTASQSGTAGVVTFSAVATDASPITIVYFYVDNVLRGSDTTAPYSMTFNSTALTNGAHVLQARARDQFSQEGLSANVNFNIAN